MKTDLEASWERACGLAEQAFDRDGSVNRVIRQAATQNRPPSREDLAVAADHLCQVIKATIAAAEAIAERMNNS